jgi:4-oxalocrotonate tautomerase
MIAIHIVRIQMYNRRNQREKDRLAEAITENIKREVIIVFTEPAHGNWYA